MGTKDHNIQRLREAVESVAGRRMLTPKDFDYLRNCIYEKCHEMVSISTLKRLWGYNRYDNTPRKSSLNPIARYVGFRDWYDFLQHNSNNEEREMPEELSPSTQKENPFGYGIS